MNLPDEILLNIFEYLSIDDLLKFSLTNKYFNILIKDNNLWHKIFIRDYYIIDYNQDIDYRQECYDLFQLCFDNFVLNPDEKRLSVWRYVIYTNPRYQFD